MRLGRNGGNFFLIFFFFFFRQKTAYEIRLSLVGSEICIRDSLEVESSFAAGVPRGPDGHTGEARPHQVEAVVQLLIDVAADGGSSSCCSDAAEGQPPRNYLLQHAAGSGKSLTIAALALGLLRTVCLLRIFFRLFTHTRCALCPPL